MYRTLYKELAYSLPAHLRTGMRHLPEAVSVRGALPRPVFRSSPELPPRPSPSSTCPPIWKRTRRIASTPIPSSQSEAFDAISSAERRTDCIDYRHLGQGRSSVSSDRTVWASRRRSRYWRASRSRTWEDTTCIRSLGFASTVEPSHRTLRTGRRSSSTFVAQNCRITSPRFSRITSKRLSNLNTSMRYRGRSRAMRPFGCCWNQSRVSTTSSRSSKTSS